MKTWLPCGYWWPRVCSFSYQSPNQMSPCLQPLSPSYSPRKLLERWPQVFGHGKVCPLCLEHNWEENPVIIPFGDFCLKIFFDLGTPMSYSSSIFSFFFSDWDGNTAIPCYPLIPIALREKKWKKVGDFLLVDLGSTLKCWTYVFTLWKFDMNTVIFKTMVCKRCLLSKWLFLVFGCIWGIYLKFWGI